MFVSRSARLVARVGQRRTFVDGLVSKNSKVRPVPCGVIGGSEIWGVAREMLLFFEDILGDADTVGGWD